MERKLAIAQPFDLELSLTMGQAFRWRSLEDGWFSGVLGDYLVHIRRTTGGVEYRAGSVDGATDADLSELLCRYFRLDTDNIGAIYDELCGDRQVATMIWRYRGLRLLRQEPWECLVSYICSRSNSIGNISANVETIAEFGGRKVAVAGEERYLFPTAADLFSAGKAALEDLRLVGRRHPGPAIFDAARLVVSGQLRLDEMAGWGYGYNRLIGELKQIDGVGYKIADCVALFALNETGAFPYDRWVHRAMAQWYDDFPIPKREEVPTDREHRAIADWAAQRFGPFAGYAGQYLFHGRRQEEAQLPFGDKWRGKFLAAPKEGPRWAGLAEKYL